MTDKRADRLVQNADSYDPDAVRDLHGADQALLEEIMSIPPIKQLIPKRKRRVLLSGIGLAAAAALTVAVAAPALLSNHYDGPEVAGPTQGQGVHTDKGQIVYAAATIKAAEKNPRLLIDEPGWKVTHVYGFIKDNGTIEFANGDRSVEMNWYPAAGYDTYYQDRLGVSEPEPMTIDGQQSDLFRYSDKDFAVMLKPDGVSFAELRVQGNWNGKSEILAVLAKVKKVDVETWLATMSPEIVTPARASAVTNEITSDMTLPPGFSKAKYANLGTNDRYQFGAQIVGDVICGWLNEWQRANKAGDRATVKQAVEALKGGRDWKILDEMDTRGDYPEGAWQIADQVAVGKDPLHFQEVFGCE